MSKPIISAISCVYNDAGRGYLDLMMRSLIDTHGDIPVELCIVNNGSTDNTEEVISKYESHIPIRKERNEKNAGIIALNQAARLATAPYLLINLSSDVVLMHGCLQVLLKKMKLLEGYNNGKATTSATLVEPIGSALDGKFYKDNLGTDPKKVDYHNIINYKPKQYKPDRWYWTIPMLVPTWLWNEVGGYSDYFSCPGNYSDMDFANKLLTKDTIMLLCGDAVAYHFVSATFKSMDKDTNGESKKLRERSTAKNGNVYAQKWGSRSGPLKDSKIFDWNQLNNNGEDREMSETDKNNTETPEAEQNDSEKAKPKRKAYSKPKGKKLKTGKRGRPAVAEEQNMTIDVGGKEVPISVDVPKKAEIVVTKVEAKTRHEIDFPVTSPERVKQFKEEYFDANNLVKRHPKIVKDRKLLAQYVLNYITPKRVLCCGCAAGDEVNGYLSQDVDVLGQDIVDVAYPELSAHIKIGEIYDVWQKHNNCDTIQLFDVVQYLEQPVYDRLVRFLKETKQIKYIVFMVMNHGYKMQDNKLNQAQFDQDIGCGSIFKKVNEVDDYKFRAISLVHPDKSYQCYGLMPAKSVWIYERVAAYCPVEK